MSDKNKYKQCVLFNENRRTVSWVPIKFAKEGKKVTVDGESGWTIVSVSNFTIDNDKRKLFESQYRTQREATDI